MNTTEILAAYDEAGITADEVVTSLAAHERVVAEYSVRCAQTVIVTATVDSKRKSKADLARETGASAMQVGRYYAAGLILIAHPDLDAEQVMAYANTHTQAECKAVAKMTEEEAAAAVKPVKGAGGSQKSEAEKDAEALTRLLSRIRKAAEEGDTARVEAFDNAITTILPDAIAAAYAEVSGEASEEEAV